jgi:hypothetical protein
MRLAVSVVVLAGVLFASPVAAQQRQMGVKVGPTFPALSVDPDDADYKTRLGAVFGGFMVFPLNDRFAVQLEALYTAKGGKATSDLVEESLTFKLDYVEFPILARVSASRTAQRDIFLFGGVAPAIRFAAKVETGLSDGSFTSGVSTDVGEDYTHFDVAAIVGGGVDIGPYITVDGRYSWGLMNVYDNPEIDVKVHNRAFTFTVGVRF